MLSKLMKYDFRDQGRLQWPLQLAVVLGGLLAGFCLAYNLTPAGMMTDEPGPMQIVMVVVITLVMIMIAASSIVTQVLIAKQYYQNCFCDEGYLTFTLPVPTGRILLSKVLTGSLWILINLVAVLVGVGLFFWAGLGSVWVRNPQMMARVAELWAEFKQVTAGINLSMFVFEYILLLLISSASSVVMLHFVVTMGNQLARKHKVLCAVGIYFLLTFAISVVSGIASSGAAIRMTLMDTFDWGVYMSYMNGVLWVSMLLSVVFMVVMYYFTDRTLKNKLNLE